MWRTICLEANSLHQQRDIASCTGCKAAPVGATSAALDRSDKLDDVLSLSVTDFIDNTIALVDQFLLDPTDEQREIFESAFAGQMEELDAQFPENSFEAHVTDLVNTAVAAETDLRRGLPPFQTPSTQGETYYHARVRSGNGEIYSIRGMTDAWGNYTLFLPLRANLLSVSFFNPTTWTYGFASPSGRGGIDFPYMSTPVTELVDSDEDGLSDLAEWIIGTDPFNPDTNGNGIPDGVIVANGGDPLDGLPAATGILGTASVEGTARDIDALNNLVAVAAEAGGVSLFNVFNGMTPILVGHTRTRQSSLDVSLSGNLMAVADGTAGLAVHDIGDPTNIRVLHLVPADLLGGGIVRAVDTQGDFAAVGSTGGRVSLVDMNHGVVLGSIATNSVDDVAFSGEYLYAYAGNQFRVMSYLDGPLEVVGALALPNANFNERGRLFAGTQEAYLVHRTGFRVIDISNPGEPQILTNGTSPQFGWRDLVANGSGLGIAALGPNQGLQYNDSNNVSVYNLFDPLESSLNDLFRLEIPTPGSARAISLFNGFAYVADHQRGLQVINYLAWDNQGTPPVGELVTKVSKGSVVRGSQILLQAQVTDDVQIRNVEFFINGQRIMVDGNYPFELLYRLPSDVESPIEFTAIARDTGFNTTELNTINLDVIDDVEPPSVIISHIANSNGQDRMFSGDTVLVELILFDNVAVDFDSLRFFVDDVEISVRRDGGLVWDIGTWFRGDYELTVQMSDFSGNLGYSEPVSFRLGDQAITREFSLHVDDMAPDALHREAITREFSIHSDDTDPEALLNESISREFSVGIEHDDEPESSQLGSDANN